MYWMLTFYLCEKAMHRYFSKIWNKAIWKNVDCENASTTTLHSIYFVTISPLCEPVRRLRWKVPIKFKKYYCLFHVCMCHLISTVTLIPKMSSSVFLCNCHSFLVSFSIMDALLGIFCLSLAVAIVAPCCLPDRFSAEFRMTSEGTAFYASHRYDYDTVATGS